MKKTSIALTALSAALALASSAAFAQSATGTSGWYVRGEAGKTRLSNNNNSNHTSDNSYGVRGGYNITPNFGVESFYNHYYDNSSSNPLMSQNVRVQGYGAGVTGKVRIAQDQAAQTGWFGSGRAGLMHSETRVETQYTGLAGQNVRYTAGSNQPYVGVGVGYDFTPKFGVSANYDYFHGNAKDKASGSSLKYNANTVAGGIEYRF